MDWVFVIYLLIGIVGVVIGYLGIRAIDYAFGKKESNRRYNHVKGCIKCFNQGQRQMAISLTKEINRNLFDMYKKLGDL